MPAEGLAVLLRSFRLPTMAAIWEESVARAERENWGYKRLLQHLCESEEQDRRERKVQRLLNQSGLPDGKTLGNLDEKILPTKIRRLLPTLLEGQFVERAENLLAFGLPGRGKTHLLAAVGRELILRHRYPVLFTPTFKLVQQLLAAKKELRLESELKRLDRFAAVILDDIGYVQQDRQEMEVLFTFLAERYERRSVLISSNLVFSKWDQIFKDPMTTMAAIDRLVHHATILEFTNESVRGQQARGRQKSQVEPLAPEVPFGSTASLAPDGAKDSVPPKGTSPQRPTLENT
jgi:DNA replication protein DnaC